MYAKSSRIDRQEADNESFNYIKEQIVKIVLVITFRSHSQVKLVNHGKVGHLSKKTWTYKVFLGISQVISIKAKK